MTAPIKGMGCIRCMYYEKTDANYGECRRYAPHPNAATFVPKVDAVGSIKVDVHWPKVYDTNWCGQFAGRKPEQMEENKPKPAAVRPRPVTPPEGGAEFQLKPEEEPVHPSTEIDIS